MDCGRIMIYFSLYENGVKIRPAGYMSIFAWEEHCDVQLYYRETNAGEKEQRFVCPMYLFRDGMVVRGDELRIEEGMAAMTVPTGRQDFLQSGRSLEELEAVYLDGVASGICGGRPDGQGLFALVQDASDKRQRTENRKQTEPQKNCPRNCAWRKRK